MTTLTKYCLLVVGVVTVTCQDPEPTLLLGSSPIVGQRFLPPWLPLIAFVLVPLLPFSISSLYLPLLCASSLSLFQAVNASWSVLKIMLASVDTCVLWS